MYLPDTKKNISKQFYLNIHLSPLWERQKKYI